MNTAVTMPDGSRTSAAGIGTASVRVQDSKGVSQTMTFGNVLHVPNFSHNLMSVKTATRKGATFVFGEESYTRAPNSSVKIPLNTENNLYTIKVRATHKFVEVNCVQADVVDTPTWVKLLVYICSILTSLKVSLDEIWSRKFYSAWTAFPFTAEPVIKPAGRQDICCCDVRRLTEPVAEILTESAERRSCCDVVRTWKNCVAAPKNCTTIIQEGIGDVQRRSTGNPSVYCGQKKKLFNIHTRRRA